MGQPHRSVGQPHRSVGLIRFFPPLPETAGCSRGAERRRLHRCCTSNVPHPSFPVPPPPHPPQFLSHPGLFPSPHVAPHPPPCVPEGEGVRLHLPPGPVADHHAAAHQEDHSGGGRGPALSPPPPHVQEPLPPPHYLILAAIWGSKLWGPPRCSGTTRAGGGPKSSEPTAPSLGRAPHHSPSSPAAPRWGLLWGEELDGASPGGGRCCIPPLL